MTWWKWALLGAGVLGGGALLVNSNAIQVRVLAAGLPAAGKPFAPFIIEAAERFGLNAWILAGLMSRESGFGIFLAPKGPGGTGDFGHGHGLMQIDDRTWGAWLAANDWRDPRTNIFKGAEILATYRETFAGDYRRGLAAYNAGPKNVKRMVSQGKDPDLVTTKQNYGADVLRRARDLESIAAARA